jgi:prepilin-type N-terminal cleavage/methylation domain-containing protein
MKSLRHSSTSLHEFDRRGFSLIEVIVATAILLGSVVVLSQLAGLGGTYAQNTEQMSLAQRVCENTLNELLVGIRPLVPAESAPLMPLKQADVQTNFWEEDMQEEVLRPGRIQDRLVGAGSTPRWLHSIRLAPSTEMPGLTTLTVEVLSTRPGKGRATLTRWIRQASVNDPFGEVGGESEQEFGGFAQ